MRDIRQKLQDDGLDPSCDDEEKIKHLWQLYVKSEVLLIYKWFNSDHDNMLICMSRQSLKYLVKRKRQFTIEGPDLYL